MSKYTVIFGKLAVPAATVAAIEALPDDAKSLWLKLTKRLEAAEIDAYNSKEMAEIDRRKCSELSGKVEGAEMAVVLAHRLNRDLRERRKLRKGSKTALALDVKINRLTGELRRLVWWVGK